LSGFWLSSGSFDFDFDFDFFFFFFAFFIYNKYKKRWVGGVGGDFRVKSLSRGRFLGFYLGKWVFWMRLGGNLSGFGYFLAELWLF
jgi:hypothetical protein